LVLPLGLVLVALGPPPLFNAFLMIVLGLSPKPPLTLMPGWELVQEPLLVGLLVLNPVDLTISLLVE
jgi:hypothetical protein